MPSIYGVGTDLVAIQRVEAALEKHGERFAKRLLDAVEQAECAEKPHLARTLAKRFAVKEAFSKAFGTGIGAEVGWHDLRVSHDPKGKPVLVFSDALSARMRDAGAGAVHVSISDEIEHALAFVVIERLSG